MSKISSAAREYRDRQRSDIDGSTGPVPKTERGCFSGLACSVGQSAANPTTFGFSNPILPATDERAGAAGQRPPGDGATHPRRPFPSGEEPGDFRLLCAGIAQPGAGTGAGALRVTVPARERVAAGQLEHEQDRPIWRWPCGWSRSTGKLSFVTAAQHRSRLRIQPAGCRRTGAAAPPREAVFFPRCESIWWRELRSQNPNRSSNLRTKVRPASEVMCAPWKSTHRELLKDNCKGRLYISPIGCYPPERLHHVRTLINNDDCDDPGFHK